MKTQEVKATSFVLGGTLLTMFNNIAGGWASVIATLIGFIILLIGLNSLKKMLDDKGNSALNLIFIAAIIGAVGGLIGWIPIVGLVAGILFLAAFIIQLIGYLQLKGSAAIGETGAKGANMLFISMIIALVGGIFSLIPGIGGIIAAIVGVVVLLMIFSGWKNIQMGIIGEDKVKVTAITYILAGMLIQIGNTAVSGWAAAIASIIGFVLFLMGLNKLKGTLDEVGQSAVQLIVIAAYVGILASVLDFVSGIVGVGSGLKAITSGNLGGLAAPSTFDMIVAIVFIAAFILELLGFLKLKGSEMINEQAKGGITLLVIAVILAPLANLFSGILPIGGGFIASLLGLAGLFLVLFGWIKVQTSFVETETV